MKGILVTPKYILKCKYCGIEEEVEIEGEADIPTELLPWVCEGEFYTTEGQLVKEGSIVEAVCPKCSEVHQAVPKDWIEV